MNYLVEANKHLFIINYSDFIWWTAGDVYGPDRAGGRPHGSHDDGHGRHARQPANHGSSRYSVQPITAAPAIQFSQSQQLTPFSSTNHRSSRHLVQPITADPAIQFGQSQQLPPFSSANHSSSRHSFQPIKALPYISIPLIRAPHTMQRNGKNYFLGWQKN